MSLREEYEDAVQEDEEEDEELEDDEDDLVQNNKQSKKRSNPFVDDMAGESEDDEEDDEVVRKGQKKKNKKRNKFIDDAAVDTDEDEDDEEDIEEEDMGGLIAPEDELNEPTNDDQAYRRHRDLDRDQDISEEEMLKRMQEKWHQQKEVEVRNDMNVVNQQSLLPDQKKDPKLWLVQVKRAHEKEVCLQLYQKYFYLLSQGRPLQFTSAFCVDALGFVYVEADKEAHVIDAIRGLRSVYYSKGAKLVPISQMVDTLSINRVASKLIEPDKYVRIKYGPYKGDLAQVVDVNIATEALRVKVVPRLDFGQLTGKTEKQPFGKTKIKPPPKPFNEEEMKQLRLPVERKGRFKGTNDAIFKLNTLHFVQGYLLKGMSMRMVNLVERPPIEELQTFVNASMQGDSSALNNVSQLAASLPQGGIVQKSQFVTGDKVMVTMGDLQGLEGRVVGYSVDGSVNIKPDMDDLKDQDLPIEPGHLVKSFKLGDHVKVAFGQNEGNSGMVTGIEGKIVTLICDDNTTSLNAFANDLKLTDHVDPTTESANAIKLHELVTLSEGLYGIIIDTDKDTCKVMTTDSQVDRPDIKVYKYNELRRWPLHNVRKNVAPDANGRNITRDDIVSFQQSSLKGKTATVIYVVKQSIFVMSRDIKVYGGITSCPSRIVSLRGGVQLNGPSLSMQNGYAPQSPYGSVPLSPGKSPIGYAPQSPYRSGNIGYTGGDMYGGLRSPIRDPGGNKNQDKNVGSYQQFNNNNMKQGTFSGRTPQVRPDANIVGKDVRIKGGSFRGYKGKVIHATDLQVRVQLQAQSRVYTIKREQVQVEDGSQKNNSRANQMSYTPQTGAQGTLYDGHTPQTPIRSMKTPMYNSKTPAYDIEDGGRTPGYNPNPYPRTPMHDTHLPPTTPRSNYPSSPTHTATTQFTNTPIPKTLRDPFADDEWDDDDELQENDINDKVAFNKIGNEQQVHNSNAEVNSRNGLGDGKNKADTQIYNLSSNGPVEDGQIGEGKEGQIQGENQEQDLNTKQDQIKIQIQNQNSKQQKQQVQLVNYISTPQLDEQMTTPDITNFQGYNITQQQPSKYQQQQPPESSHYQPPPSSALVDNMNTPLISPGGIPTTPGVTFDPTRISTDLIMDISDYGVYKHIEVEFNRGKHGYIASVDSHGTCIVVLGYQNGDKWEFSSKGQEFQIPIAQLKIVRPDQINAEVKFINDSKSSNNKGFVGRLAQIDNEDGVVVVNLIDVKIAPITDLANFVTPT